MNILLPFFTLQIFTTVGCWEVCWTSTKSFPSLARNPDDEDELISRTNITQCVFDTNINQSEASMSVNQPIRGEYSYLVSHICTASPVWPGTLAPDTYNTLSSWLILQTRRPQLHLNPPPTSPGIFWPGNTRDLSFPDPIHPVNQSEISIELSTNQRRVFTWSAVRLGDTMSLGHATEAPPLHHTLEASVLSSAKHVHPLTNQKREL